MATGRIPPRLPLAVTPRARRALHGGIMIGTIARFGAIAAFGCALLPVACGGNGPLSVAMPGLPDASALLDGALPDGAAIGDGGGVGATCATASAISCNGTCVDLSSDPANCGACGTACSATQTCSGSACVCPAGTITC